jgi:hypothetical protein
MGEDMNPRESYRWYMALTRDAWKAYQRAEISRAQWEALRAPLWAAHEERERAYKLRIAMSQNATIGAY